MTDSDREKFAEQEYSKSYADCNTHEKRHIAGKFAASVRFGGAAGGAGGAAEAAEAEPPSADASMEAKHTVVDEAHQRMAQAEYGRSYDDLNEHERRHVGAKLGAQTRKAGHGGQH